MSFFITAGDSMEISKMLKRLQAEADEKNQEIERLKDINRLQEMIGGPLQSGQWISNNCSKCIACDRFFGKFKSTCSTNVHFLCS